VTVAKVRGATTDLERFEVIVRLGRREVEGEVVVSGAGLAPLAVAEEWERFAAMMAKLEPGDEKSERRFEFMLEAREAFLEAAEELGFASFRGVTPQGVEFLGFREGETGRFASLSDVVELVRAFLTGFE
jgi:hypothetical protein